MTDGGGTVKWPAEDLAIECGSCNTTVSAKVVGQVEVYDDEADASLICSLMRCPSCGSPIVSSRWAVQWGDPDDVEVSAPVGLFPSPPRELSEAAPVGVRRDYAEAQLCFRAGGFTAAAVMVRRTVEGIMAEFGTGRRGALAVRIRQLRERGVIDDRLAVWAEALKTLGNAAAHPGEEISREDAADVLMFAEALADYLFTYRSRYDEFEARQQRRRQPVDLVKVSSPAERAATVTDA